MKRLLSVFGICFLLSQGLQAQNWGGGVDEDALHFGFTFQYLNSEYKILKKKNWRDPFVDENGDRVTDSLNSIFSKSSPGFGIGFVSDYRLGENADLRFTPTLVFNDRKIYYEYQNDGPLRMSAVPVEKKVIATMVDLPLGIKLKSDRRMNYRAYILAGAKYSMNIVSAKKTNDDAEVAVNKFLKNKKSFFSYEAAFGLDLYFEYFKMSPEIKLSYSMNNLLDNKVRNPYNEPLERLTLRHVTFSLFFE
jgi:hypothetical protein